MTLLTSICLITVTCLIGAICGALIVWLILKPKLKVIQQINEDIYDENRQLEINYRHKQDLYASIENEITKRKNDYNFLASKYNQLLEQLKDLETNQKETLNEHLTLVQKEYEGKEDKVKSEFEDAKNEFQQEYLQVLQDSVDQYKVNITNSQQTYIDLQNKISDLQCIVDAAVEANKRAAEMQEKQNFYKITLSDIDIEEIEKLRSVLPYLRQIEPLNKVIWKVYYEKPTTDLIGRVLDGKIITGIYKITEIATGKCYVGQAVNVADRMRQHIKRGLGAETPTRNKLYPAMYEKGVENFTFELLEECSRSQLDEREDYWQDFYHAKDFGYSIK